MPRARKHLVCLNTTPYYHVVSRCVRRAFLCGNDRYSGRCYEHRRGWIEDRLRILSSLFSTELCAYAVMSNHYHLVIKLTNEHEEWSDDEVLDRWTSIFRGPILLQKYLAGDRLGTIERVTVRSMTAVYRQRLGSLSWFMKCLNEPIARRANKEDDCTGHFWESRFHSQALCSEQALIAAMAYVDLNPVRSGAAESPESSTYTSIYRRLNPKPESAALSAAISRLVRNDELKQFNVQVRPLLAFADQATCVTTELNVLPIRSVEYLKLIDLTGRIVTKGKRGRIDAEMAPILERLNLSSDEWLSASTEFKQHYRHGRLNLGRTA